MGHVKLHYDMVAVTDHMRCGYACSLGALGGSELAVLPGMEVNLVGEAALSGLRLHLIVLLPEGSTVENFARLFSGMQDVPADDASRSGQEEIRDTTLAKWVKRVHDEQGLCIASHVDNAQGVRSHFRQTAINALSMFSEAKSGQLEREGAVGDSLKAWLFDSGLDAVEVTKASDTPHYVWESPDGRTRKIPTLLTSDPHCIEEFDRPARTTHIKMMRPNLASLRSALVFSDTRVRFPDHLPPTPGPSILGVQIFGSPDSYFGDICVGFAGNLNCIIGARGSGKSSLLEAIRYTLGQNRNLEEHPQLQSSVTELQKANLAGSTIRVVYRLHGVDYVLEATYDPRTESTRIYRTSGQSEESLTPGDFPVSIFSWGEIEGLGRDAARQRELLDRLVPGLSSRLEARADLKRSLAMNRDEVSAQVTTILAFWAKHEPKLTVYESCLREFQSINTVEAQTLFRELDECQAKRAALSRLKDNALHEADQFGSSQPLVLLSGAEFAGMAPGQALADWWQTVAERLQLSDAVSTVESLAIYTQRLLKLLAEAVNSEMTQMDMETNLVRDRVATQLQANVSTLQLADLRANAQSRLDSACVLRDQYLALWSELETLLDARALLVDTYSKIQAEITSIRLAHNKNVEEQLNKFLPSHMRIRLALEPSGDVGALPELLVRFVQQVYRFKARRVANYLAESLPPLELAAALRHGQLRAGTYGREGDALTLSAEECGKIVASTRFRRDDDQAMAPVLETNASDAVLPLLLALEEADWDDRETILLNDRPIDECSPGQRSSAMLPLIALAESRPLIIDQPEDNLDNRLISDVVVGVLSELKERRQIILCTHNPNILVGGDAEQVVVLDSASGHCNVLRQGSVDDTEIISHVIGLLEGGKDAFEARRLRYSEAG